MNIVTMKLESNCLSLTIRIMKLSYEEWTVVQLKNELKKRDLSQRGKKLELVERLKEDVANGSERWTTEENEVDIPPFHKHPGPIVSLVYER